MGAMADRRRLGLGNSVPMLPVLGQILASPSGMCKIRWALVSLGRDLHVWARVGNALTGMDEALR